MHRVRKGLNKSLENRKQTPSGNNFGCATQGRRNQINITMGRRHQDDDRKSNYSVKYKDGRFDNNHSNHSQCSPKPGVDRDI